MKTALQKELKIKEKHGLLVDMVRCYVSTMALERIRYNPMKKLKLLYEHHLALALPASPENDELAESLDKIRELDGFVVGLVTTYLDQEHVVEFSTNRLEQVRLELQRLTNLSGGDQNIRADAYRYLSSLEDMAKVLRNASL